jgi:hypothetical protein
MSRRSTPERIDAARHAAVRNSLVSDGLSSETADSWIAAWEAKAVQDDPRARRGVSGGWLGVDHEQRKHRVRP